MVETFWDFGFYWGQVALIFLDQSSLEKSRAMGLVAREKNNHRRPAVSSILVPVEAIAPPPNRIVSPSNFED